MYANTGDKATSVTKAGIADGTLIVKDGSGAGIARGTTELQQDGLKEIYDARKVAETMEMQQVAGQVGFTAAGDLSNMMRERAQQDLDAAKRGGSQSDIDAAQARVNSWSEGGSNKVILHGLVGAGAAALGGGNAVEGLGVGAANQITIGNMVEYLEDHQIDPDSTEGRALLLTASALVGGALGGGDGTGIAVAATSYNYLTHAQLDELEKNLAKCGADQACRQQELDRAENLSAIQDQELYDACVGASKNPGLCGIHVEGAQQYVANDSVGRLGLQDDQNKSNEWLGRFYDTPDGEPYRGNFWGNGGLGLIDSGSTMFTGLVGMIGYIGELAFVPGAGANPETGQLEYNPLIKPTPIFGADPTAGPIGQKGYEFGDALGTAFSATSGSRGGAAKIEEVVSDVRQAAAAKAGSIATEGGKTHSVSGALLEELSENGVKFTPENIVATTRDATGRIVFLETGNPKAGLQHIVQEHGAEFAQMGVAEGEIPALLMKAVAQGRVVGYQGAGMGRPIYEVAINGQRQRIAITIGNNGYIVGANPRGGL